MAINLAWMVRCHVREEGSGKGSKLLAPNLISHSKVTRGGCSSFFINANAPVPGETANFMVCRVRQLVCPNPISMAIPSPGRLGEDGDRTH